jgi:hypothetical protein
MINAVVTPATQMSALEDNSADPDSRSAAGITAKLPGSDETILKAEDRETVTDLREPWRRA